MRKSVIAIIIIVLVVLFMSVFVVKEGERGITLRFGKVLRDDENKPLVVAPGLHFKIPFIESVKMLDARIQTMDNQADRFVTKEKKDLIVDSYIKWRIQNPLQFYISFGSNTAAAQNRLNAQIRDALNASVNTRTVRAVVSQERDVVMAEILQNVEERAKPLGIEVVDVRLKRIEFSQEVSDSVYSRMQAERKQEANSLRANGAAESETIRADADRRVQEELATANAKAQAIRGEGEAEATKIYAQAFNKNPDFYSFYNSMNAYRNVFSSKSDLLVVDPESDFFRFFNQSSGTR